MDKNNVMSCCSKTSSASLGLTSVLPGNPFCYPQTFCSSQCLFQTFSILNSLNPQCHFLKFRLIRSISLLHNKSYESIFTSFPQVSKELCLLLLKANLSTGLPSWTAYLLYSRNLAFPSFIQPPLSESSS